MAKLLPALAGCVGIIMVTLPGSVGAAELPTPAFVSAPVYCGPCGCLRVAYNYHPELRSTYGLGFDPRNYPNRTIISVGYGPIRSITSMAYRLGGWC